MKKMFPVLLAVLALSLSVFAAPKSTVYDYSFDTYCDGVEITVSNNYATLGPGYPQVFIGGFHDLTTACGLFYNGTVVGLVHGLGATVPPHNGASGKVFDLADNAADAQGFPSPNFSGIQIQFVLDPTANTWAVYGCFGFGDENDFLLNFGTMTPGPTKPAHPTPGTGKTTIGTFKAAPKKS
jgi:hypothetical protein